MRNKSPKQREPKKTVSVEVRVSEADKSAFLKACQAANRPASSVLRSLMGLFVSLQTLRQRILAMLNGLFHRPLSAAFSSIAIVAGLSASLIMAPVAAAELRLAYEISVDDGVGLIVSQGEADFEGGVSVGDRLGEGVRYALEAVPCGAEAGRSCPQGSAHAVLRVWEAQEGRVETVTGRGIIIAQSGETRFETTLSDGRTLAVVLASKAPV